MFDYKQLITLLLLSISISLLIVTPIKADSILTLPMPTGIPLTGAGAEKVRPMKLTISIPPILKQPPRKKKLPPPPKPRPQFNYFEFKPFPKIRNIREIKKKIKKFYQLGLGKGELNQSLVPLLSRGLSSNNIYEVSQMVTTLFKNFLRISDEEVIKIHRWNKKDLTELKSLYKDFKKHLFRRFVDTDEIEKKFKHIEKLLKLNQGIVRVVRVIHDERGGTTLHLVFQEAPEEEKIPKKRHKKGRGLF